MGSQILPHAEKLLSQLVHERKACHKSSESRESQIEINGMQIDNGKDFPKIVKTKRGGEDGEEKWHKREGCREKRSRAHVGGRKQVREEGHNGSLPLAPLPSTR